MEDNFHYECRRCKKNFLRQNDMKRHLMRTEKCEKKNPDFNLTDEENHNESLKPIFQEENNFIKPDLNTFTEEERGLMCEFCFTPFSTRSNRYRHEKFCKKKENSNYSTNIDMGFTGDNNSINNTVNNNNNNNNISVSMMSELEKKVARMVQFEHKYDQSEFSKDSFFGLLLQSVYNKTLSKLLENQNNINILPKDKDSSYILINDNIYIIDNTYLAKETSEKLKSFLLSIRNEIQDEFLMDTSIYNTISELIMKRSKDDNKDKYMKIYRQKMKDIHIPSVKKILKIEDKHEIETVDDVMTYIENLKISVITDIKNIGNRKVIMKDANNKEHEVSFSKDGVFIFF